jgi:hypothetical protein
LAACGVPHQTAKNEWSVIHGRGIAPRAILRVPGKCDFAFNPLVIHLLPLSKFVTQTPYNYTCCGAEMLDVVNLGLIEPTHLRDCLHLTERLNPASAAPECLYCFEK